VQGSLIFWHGVAWNRLWSGGRGWYLGTVHPTCPIRIVPLSNAPSVDISSINWKYKGGNRRKECEETNNGNHKSQNRRRQTNVKSRETPNAIVLRNEGHFTPGNHGGAEEMSLYLESEFTVNRHSASWLAVICITYDVIKTKLKRLLIRRSVVLSASEMIEGFRTVICKCIMDPAQEFNEGYNQHWVY